MTDVFSPDKRREIMRRVARANTAPERLLDAVLKSMRLRYTRHAKHLLGRPDFYISRLNVAIFVHGCFWHGHTGCKKGRTCSKTRAAYWRGRVETNQRRDRRIARKLRETGISVLTVWECQLRHGRIPARISSRLLGRLPVRSGQSKARLNNGAGGKQPSRQPDVKGTWNAKQRVLKV
jgi:DNA mismatch endonuclease, patch repair protein